MALINSYRSMLKKEFTGYNLTALKNDFMAGLTVTAVAIPLALAFAISSGADAAAGLITAIIAGLVIGGLSGASFQISGPTGAMSAILIPLIARYGLNGMFWASLLSGVLLLLCAFLKAGKLVRFIPPAVITGFTSGIAIIIAFGQIDNFFGVSSKGETLIEKLLSYGKLGFSVNPWNILIGLAVIGIMVLYPKKWSAKFPASLLAIIIATAANIFFKLPVSVVGEIPRTLLPQARLDFASLDIAFLPTYIMPALSIAALGMIESLLCGAAGGKMKNEPLDADTELVAQGVGNILLPFFGGVPATAAIARTSVAIKSGAVTRLTSIFHSVGILASMFLLSGIMSQIPLAALSGVLMMTAFRMNEWESIAEYFSSGKKLAIAQFLITMAATVMFDLVVAIVIGMLFSVAVSFIAKIPLVEKPETEAEAENEV